MDGPSCHFLLDADSLTVERLFDAPRALVWEAWTHPALLSQWWGPVHYPATHIDMDIRPGGQWRNRLTSVETGDALWHNGTFREVVPLEKLVFTFVWEEAGERGQVNEVTVTFSDHGAQTRVVLVQAPFQSTAEAEGHGDGWGSSFDRLETLLSFPMEISA